MLKNSSCARLLSLPSNKAEWDPLWLSKQWPESFEVSRVLVLGVINGSTFEDGDIISTIVDDVAVPTSSNWDPASISKPWPEFVEGDWVLSWKTVEEWAIVEWDITYLVSLSLQLPNEILYEFPNSGLNCLRVAGHLGICEKLRWVLLHLPQQHGPLVTVLEH